MPTTSSFSPTTTIARSAIDTLILLGAAASAALLLYLSYRFEAMAYSQILGTLGARPLFAGSSVTLAEGLAAGLNTAKVALIYVAAQHLVRRRGWRTLLPRAVHAFLITVSLVMTLLVIGGQTISPDAERRLTSLLESTEARFSSEAARLEAAAASQREAIRQSYEAERTQLSAAHLSRMAELQEGLDAERDNVIDGEFYGPRYQDFERNIELERAAFASRTDELRAREEAAMAALADTLVTDLSAVQGARDTALSGISLGSVFDVEEAQNPYLLRFLEIARYIAPEGVEIEIVFLTVFVAVMISLGVEISPLVVLGYVFRSLGRQEETTAEVRSVEPQPVNGDPANDNNPQSEAEARANRAA